MSEFLSVNFGPAVTFAFPDPKVGKNWRSVQHLNLISAVDWRHSNGVGKASCGSEE